MSRQHKTYYEMKRAGAASSSQRKKKRERERKPLNKSYMDMIYEDRGSETKRKERKHLQREIECVSPPHPTSNLNSFFFSTFSHSPLYFYPLFRGARGFSRPSSRRHCRRRVMISEHLHASSQNRCRSITSRASAALCWRGFFVFLF